MSIREDIELVQELVVNE